MTIILNKKIPNACARAWLRTRPNLIRTDKEFLDWNGARNCYAPVEDEAVASSVHLFLDKAEQVVMRNVTGRPDTVAFNEPFNPHPKDTEAVVKCIIHLAQKPHAEYAACWLDGNDKHPNHAPTDIIAMHNGLLHLPTRTLLKKTPLFFTRAAVAIDYDLKAPLPKNWIEYVKQVMAGRPHLGESLHEMMGYIISGYREMQRLFFSAGPPRGGKGTKNHVLEALCGIENCAHPSMEQLNERYGLETSAKATFSVVTDATSNGLLQHAANNLKQVSGGDHVDVRNLGRQTTKSAKIRAQFWIEFNKENYPNFGGSAAAICSRATAIPFDVSFAGREDYTLYEEKLKPELSGILNLCLDAYEKLRKRGRFLETPEGEAIKSTIMRTSDVFSACLRENFEFVSGARVEQAVAARIFAEYFEDNGGIITATMLTRRLKKMGATVGRPYVGDGGERKQAPVYIGLRLNDATARTVYQWDGLCDGPLLDKGGMPLVRDMTAAEKAAADADAARDFGPGDDEGDAATLH